MSRGAILLVAFLAIFTSLGALAFGIVEFLFRSQVRPALESNRATLEANYQAYFEDLNYLARFDIAQPQASQKSDAGVFLNAKLFWEPALEALPFGATAPLITPAQREVILRLRGEWMRKNSKAKSFRLDNALFSQLSQFDYWDIEKNSPIEKLTADEEFVPPPQLPIPSVSDLMALAKVRLMKGAIEDEPLKALREVRQLAKLLMTTENMNLVLAGIAILDDERFAYRYFVDEMKMDPIAWAPADRNVTRRAARAILATRGYLRIWTPEEILRKVFLEHERTIGVCAALNEAVPLEGALRTVLEPHLPFERDYRREYIIFDAILKRAQDGRCRLRYVSHLAREDAFDVEIPGPLLLNRLPFARKVFGLRASVVNFAPPINYGK